MGNQKTKKQKIPKYLTYLCGVVLTIISLEVILSTNSFDEAGRVLLTDNSNTYNKLAIEGEYNNSSKNNITNTAVKKSKHNIYALNSKNGKKSNHTANLKPMLGLEKYHPKAKVLDNKIETISNGLFLKKSLIETDGKYPHLVVEEIVDNNGVVFDYTSKVANHIIITLDDEHSKESLLPLNNEYKGAVFKRIGKSSSYLIRFDDFDLNTVDEKIVSYSSSNVLKLAEADYVISLTNTPNDPSYNELYGLHNQGQTGGASDADIDAPEAWAISTGSKSITVGVIDTGIDYNHPDLASNIWINPNEIAGNGIDDDGNGYIDDIHGWDFVNDDNDPMDDNSHGTHCAGTIGAVGNNGTGIVGVCWNVSLAGIKFLSGSGSGYTSDAIASVLYATSVNLDMTSNSWGGGGYSQALKDAIDDAASNNILFIAAAGNSSVDNDSIPHYPSSYDSENVLAVAATDHNDELAWFSCWGATSVDLAAPGVNILSTVPGNGYSSYSGTSMATPHVAGAAALLKSLAPNLTSEQIIDQLMQSADELSSLDGLMVSGARLNVNKALVMSNGAFLTTIEKNLSDSNGDNIFSPGETASVQLTLANIGSESANGVNATLISNTPSVNVLNENINVGNILSGSTEVLQETFTINISNDATTPLEADFTLTYSDETNEVWSENFSFDVETVSTVSGIVRDLSNNSPIIGASVKYEVMIDGEITTGGETFTDQNGQYSFSEVDGTYLLQATANGFNQSQVIELELPGDKINVDFELGQSEIQITPNTISAILNSGQQITEIMTITNTGNSPLTYSISATPSSSAAGLSSIASYGPEHHKPLGKGVIDTREGNTVTTSSGGPDNFGYSWKDSNAEGGPVYNWQDISSSGNRMNVISNTLDNYEKIQLNFSFPYYGTDYDEVFVSSNGYITVGSGAWDWTNYPLPSSSAPSGQIAGFADDFFSMLGGDIYYQLFDDKLIVQYNQVRYYEGSGTATFQMVLESDGSITFYYEDISGETKSATVGIQNPDKNDGLTVVYNSDYVENGLAVSLAPRPIWLSYSPENGEVLPGESTTVSVNIDASGLNAGNYTSSLIVSNNSPASMDIEVPISLEVNAYRNLTVSPLSIDFGEVFKGNTEIKNLILTNNGNEIVTVNEFAVSNPAFAIDAVLPLLVPVGESLSLPILFSPLTFEDFEATISVISDAENEIEEISLNGVGIEPPVAVLSQDNLNFQITSSGVTTQASTLLNAGGNPLTFEISQISFGDTASFGQSSNVNVSDKNIFSQKHKPDELIIAYKNGQSSLSNPSLLENNGLSVKRQLGLAIKPGSNMPSFSKSVYLLSSKKGSDLSQIRQNLLQDPNVDYVEPNYLVSKIGIPDDSAFSQLYGMHNTGQTGGTADADIDAIEAWDKHTGNANNVLIGVIDTGINYNHPDLAANVWVNDGEIPGNGIDDDGNGYIDDIHGWDFINNDNDPMDDHGHGSHCMGTIAGSGNNGEGVAGVVWDAKVMGLKFLGASGGGSIADAVDALLYANAMGVQITNNSWGGGGYSQAMKDAIDAAEELGYLFVAAAGNSNQNNDNSPAYPASYSSDNIISVAATDHNDNKASFSSYGLTSVDIGAPGVGIYSTLLGSNYASWSGTSMATPHVAGVAALLWSYNPASGGAAVKSAILNGADPITALEGKVLTGARLNAANSLELTSPPWLSVNPESGIINPGSSVDLEVSVDSTDLENGIYSATINLSTNDPQKPQIQIQLNVEVNKDNTPPEFTEEATASPAVIMVGGVTELNIEVVDPDNDDLSYFWSVLESPSNSNVTFNDDTLKSCSASFDQIGDYLLSVTVSDGLESIESQVEVSVIEQLLIGDSGSFNVKQINKSEWKIVNLTQTYTNPVVIFSPLTFKGGQPAHIRVKNVSSQAFEWQIEEWDYLDGYHLAEKVDYIVIEAGTYSLPDGRVIVADNIVVGDSYSTHSLESFQAQPIVVAQLCSYQDETAATVRLNKITTNKFKIKLQSQEKNGKTHEDEIVSYIAVESGLYDGEFGLQESFVTGQVVNHRWYNLQFSKSYEKRPSFFGSFQTSRGGDTGDLRIKDLDFETVNVKFQEEKSKDNETRHVNEKLGYILFDLNLN